MRTRIILTGLVGLLWVGMLYGQSVVTYYVNASTGNNGNSCTQAQNPATPKQTIPSGVGCLSGGDTLIVAAGTYTNQQITDPPVGTPSAYTIIKGDPTGARPVISNNGSTSFRGFYCEVTASYACTYIRMEYFDVTGAYNSVKGAGDATNGYPHHLQFVNNKFHDTVSTNMEFNTSDGTAAIGGDHYIAGNEFYRTGVGTPGYAPGHNTIYNPGSRTIIERNTFHNLANAIGIWHSGKYLYDVIVRFNTFYDLGLLSVDTWQQGNASISGIHVSSSGGRHLIYNNVFYHSGEDGIFDYIRINPQFGKTTLLPMEIYNNTLYETLHASAEAIRATSNTQTAGVVLVKNNIALTTNGIVDQSGLSAMVTANNRTTGTPSDIWTDPTTYDLTLKAGSAAINAGTNVNLPFCTTPDQGAFEVPTVVSGSIDGNTIDLTLCNPHPPTQLLSGISGWAASCSGTGCTPTSVSSVGVVTGSDTLVRLTLSGITGDACQVGQTWTVTFSGTVTDSINIGSVLSQPLHAFGPLSLTNDCSGSAGGAQSYPGTPHIWYRFDGNANDSSGNNLHGTESGVSYVTAKYNQGTQTDDGQNDYIEVPYGNGVNPSTQSLTIAFGVYIDPSELGKTRDVIGTALGINQRFYIFRSSTNNWRMGVQDNSGTPTEFAVESGWTHVCVNFNATTDTAVLSINGNAGAVDEASAHAYTSYMLASNIRIGLPNGFSQTLGGKHLYDDFLLYLGTQDCNTLYEAWEPPAVITTAVQAAHQWQGVHLHSGAVANYNAQDATIEVVQGGAIALMVQLNCTGGDCTTLSPRFRYSLNGGPFLTIPTTAGSDGIYWWGNTMPGLNFGVADGPITGALTHTDGPTILTANTGPTFPMSTNTSYTIRGIVRLLDTVTIGAQYCLKLYDQSGGELGGYTPSSGACATVVNPMGSAWP